MRHHREDGPEHATSYFCNLHSDESDLRHPLLLSDCYYDAIF